MPAPPTQTPCALPRNVTLPEDVAMQIAELARVPDGEIPPFCNAIRESVQRVWDLDRRAVSSKPGRALFRAAEAAQTLNEAFCSLNKDDREWVERFIARDSRYAEWQREFMLTVSRIDDLFSTAIGKTFPTLPGTAALRDKRGRRKRSIKDSMFEVFIRHILLFTTEYGGKLTFDKNSQKGTLIDALELFRRHLPKGVVPNVLPYGTIQKIKTKFLKNRNNILGLSAK